MYDPQWFIRTDAAGLVVRGFTTAFDQPQAGDILVSGQSGRHFNIPLTNDRGQPLYRITSGSMLARSQAELDEEWAARPVPKTQDQLRIEELERQLAQQSADQTAFMEFILESMGGR
ncbi:hypothetical protein HGI30_15875 [Paenibacillus albicereus]|uniref:Uncharacterized protein n=1 Tax=Paenibacillus albicereus TaxID=2726185 RepID=A0A6H2H0M0_9BACL|nr:hypothetical protein [Paenibacillus albicereus]QJC52898.1 hypothetical protein HGI30_15875 [Paenibacillus albicereus]